MNEIGFTNQPPTGWGTDDLTSFFDQARQNQWATFDNHPELAKAVLFVDACYHEVSKDWTNPKQNKISCQLFFRSHIAFKTAASLAMAGQIAETSPVLRICLEYAIAALRIQRNPDLALVFLERHTTNKDRKKSKEEFSTRAYFSELKSCNIKLAKVAKDLYDNLIDFGGHPNERALSSSMEIRETEGFGTQWLQLGLHADPKYINFGIKQTTDIGLCALHILELVFPERFELLGISDRLKTRFSQDQNKSRFIWMP